LVLLGFYIPLIIISWALSCIMAHRPLMAPSYYNQIGFPKEDVKRMRGWMTVINIFNAIAGLVTITIITALVAQAAAVYIERQSTRGTLQSNHLFALADRAWSNPLVALKSSASSYFRAFIFFATFVLLLGKYLTCLPLLRPVDCRVSSTLG